MKPRFDEDYGSSASSVNLKIALESKYRDALSEFGQNHWKTSLLYNLKDNDEFCEGGFLNL